MTRTMQEDDIDGENAASDGGVETVFTAEAEPAGKKMTPTRRYLMEVSRLLKLLRNRVHC